MGVGMIIEKMYTTASDFAQHIEARVKRDKTTYFRAVLDYCEENGVEPRDITHLINKQLKERIRVDATNLNFFPHAAKLPKI